MGRWAKSHDQRKGQWLVNYVRKNIPDISSAEDYLHAIELRLWNMTNEEFDKIMEDYLK